ncbi:MAG: hypothetical protein OXE99_14945 [Cellvibrionales bacterium]|nr:hypothetical protein [Cellvibrionales bacterium]
MRALPDDLFIDVTTPDAKGLTFCEVSEVGFTRWLDQLPIANPLKMGQLLYQAAVELRYLNVPVKLRMAMLNALSRRIHQHAAMIQKNYLYKRIPLSANEGASAEVYGECFYALIQVNLSLIYAHQKKVGSIIHRPWKALHALLSDTLSLLHKLLLHNYLLYQQPKPGFWSLIHKLYRTAVFGNIHTERLVSASGLTIDGQYHCLILWGNIRAEQLTQKDLMFLNDLMPKWSDLIYSQPYSEDTLGICYNFDTDAAQSLPNQKILAGDEQCLVVNSLVSRLKEDDQVKIRSGLRAHLIRSLEEKRERRYKRFNSDERLSVVFGLSAAHFFLRDKIPMHEWVYSGAKNNQSTPKHRHFKPNIQDVHRPTIDIWHMPFALDRKPTIDAADSASTENYDLLRAKVVNASAGGYCLEFLGPKGIMLKAGEILLLDGEETWVLAQVSWLRHIKRQRYRLGVELLSPAVEPWLIKLPEVQGESQKLTRALVIPAIGEEEASVILPSLNHFVGQKLIAMNHQGQDNWTLSFETRCTGVFSEYRFQSQGEFARFDGVNKISAE